MTRSGRISCCVPFCRRTASREKFPDCSEIICSKHWRTISTPAKAEYRRLRRIERRSSLRGEAEAELWRQLDANWARCRAEAIETAMGIAA